MQRKKVDSKVEQHLITAMITSKEFLMQSATAVDVELFQAEHLKIVGRWCVEYWTTYKDAPRQNIEPIYHAWVEKGGNSEELTSAVHDVLEHFSSEFEEKTQLNVPYLVDQLAEFMTIRRLERLKGEIEYSLLHGDKSQAEQAVLGYKSVDIGIGHGTDPLNDEAAWDAAYSEVQKPLIRFGDHAADLFLGRALTRDALVAILGPEKRGKTWWCIELALRALQSHHKVALFEVGDMSEAQVLKRIGVRLSRRPLDKRDLGTIAIPSKITRTDDEVEIETREIYCDKPSRLEASKEALQRTMRRLGLKPGRPHFMLSTHPNSSVNVSDLDGILQRWEVEKNFVPDVVIVDYPDILAPEPGARDMQIRDQVNTTWKALRRLSQERHCLVLAPTQADSMSYTADTLGMTNFSEDKRKMAHVTGMLGLNQTAEEKTRGIMRLNWIVLRESPFAPNQCLYVAQCLTLGRAFCCATF